jgi:hypothetical protein
MKTIWLLIFFVTAVTSADLKSQDKPSLQLKDKMELSPAFSFSSIKLKGSSQSEYVFTLPIRLTYFVSNRLGIGGEIIYTNISEFNSGIIASMLFEEEIPLSKTILYMLAGYGLSNSRIVADRIALNTSKHELLGVLSLGGGIKIPLTDKVLGKAEIRYQNFHGKTKAENYFGESSSEKIRINYLNMAFGITLLL